MRPRFYAHHWLTPPQRGHFSVVGEREDSGYEIGGRGEMKGRSERWEGERQEERLLPFPFSYPPPRAYYFFYKPFPSCPKFLFQSEAKCEAIDMKMTLILMQIKLIFTRKALHLVSF